MMIRAEVFAEIEATQKSIAALRLAVVSATVRGPVTFKDGAQRENGGAIVGHGSGGMLLLRAA